MADSTEQLAMNTADSSYIQNQETNHHIFPNNDSAFRPTALRTNFLPSLDQIH